MPKIMLDEWNLRLFVPDRLTPAESQAIRRVINSKRFQACLTSTLHTFIRRFPSLAKVSIKLAA